MTQPCVVAFEDQALKQLAELDKPVRARIFHAVRELAVDPRPAGSIPLKGDTDAWRIRVGDYRVVSRSTTAGSWSSC